MTDCNFLSFQEEPFVYATTLRERERDNTTQWKGYIMDLIKQLQDNLKFEVDFHIVADGSYGGEDPLTKEWNGMVGELLNQVKDTTAPK